MEGLFFSMVLNASQLVFPASSCAAFTVFSGAPTAAVRHKTARDVGPVRRVEPVLCGLRLPGDLPHRGGQLSAGESPPPGEGGHQVVRSLSRSPDRVRAREPGMHR